MTAPAGDQRARLEALARLVRELEEGPESPLRARARALVGAVLDLHADALRGMLAAVAAAGGVGPALLDAFAREPGIAAVLLLHGLHPIGLEARVREALARLAPALSAQGARVADVAVTEAGVRVRVAWEAAPAGSAAAGLRARLEEALVAAAPDAATVEVEVPPPPAAFVPVERVRLRAPGVRA